MERDSTSFVDLAKKGDKSAFLYLINLEKEKLYKLAFIYTKNENDALDVFQETIAKSLEKITSLKKNEYFSTWITKILINIAIDFLKKKQKTTLIESDYNESPSNNMEIDTNLDLLKALTKLKTKNKTVLYLRYYKDLQVNEIAKILDCPVGTVKTQIHRSLAELKKILNGGNENELR
ncbi:sigma-70 family RNA polymerase sigma factor [Alkalihalobacillus sp. LMS6]|uniref:sigma-70 family RNA polymerase sigma factor n=1 Tax=Alkalihalobacillus sp. LMS6 TaxID=2924034 RepID=UPI0020D1AA1F|nr:sigma-70 family RNA polymerase sigma factor [Alkalihalobacillus sp. LMS6]UTR06100.1 sigma-70 family RNA polymerase sigma factor [Alkalihalobacillus sp. LMS6]